MAAVSVKRSFGFGFTSDWMKKWRDVFLSQSCKEVIKKAITFRHSSEPCSIVVVFFVDGRHKSYLFRDSSDVVWFKATAASDVPHSHIIGPPSVLMHIPAS